MSVQRGLAFRRVFLSSVIMVAITTFGGASASAINAELDEGFDTDGLRVGDYLDARITDVEIDAEGRTVAVGWFDADGGDPETGFIVRYLADGTFDPDFDVDGRVNLAFEFPGPVDTRITDVEIDSNGKIVVAGEVDTAFSTDVFVARYEEDGEFDVNCNGGGTFADDPSLWWDPDEIGGADEIVTGLAITSNDHIVVSGYVEQYNQVGSDDRIFVMQIDDECNQDMDFNAAETPGVWSLEADSGLGFNFDNDVYLFDVAVDVKDAADSDDDEIVAGGWARMKDDGTQRAFLLRLMNQGTLQTMFGNGDGDDGDGFSLYDWGPGPDRIDSLVFDGDQIVVTGSKGGSELVVARHNNDGELDEDFGTAGLTAPFEDAVGGLSIAIDTDGAYWVVGNGVDDSLLSVAYLVRYFDDGTIDDSIGTDGVWKPVESTGNASFATVATNPDGDHLIAAGKLEGSNDTLIAQFTVAEPAETTEISVGFDGEGSGSVTSDPVGIDTSADETTAEFDAGTSVTLTATADDGSEFVQWSDDVDCTEGQTSSECTFSVPEEPATITATFDTVSRGGGGNGRGGSSDSLPDREVDPGTGVPTGPIVDSSGAFPELSNGTSLVTVNGSGVPVEVTSPTPSALLVSGPDFSFSIAVPSPGRPSPMGTIITRIGDLLQVSGTGFQPGSMIDVWLFSTPVFVGTVTVSPDGTFSGSLTIPKSVVPGDHTLQANGRSVGGEWRSVNLGLHVDDESTTLPATGRQSSAYLVALWLLTAGLFLLASRRSFRTAHH